MKVDIICVGKIKENYWVDAIKEYTKRLSKYIKINIYEVKDEQTPDKAGEKEELMIKQAEAQRIQKYINNDAILVALAIEGKEMSSEDFSDFFADNEVHSNSHIQFLFLKTIHQKSIHLLYKILIHQFHHTNRILLK